MLCLATLKEKVPYFNAPIYLQNKTTIGKVDEILGPINQVYFSIKMGEGIVASSFKNGEKVYIAPDRLLPLERFLPKPKPPRTPCSLCYMNVLNSTSLADGESMTHSFDCNEYLILNYFFWPQNAAVEVREAQLVREGADAVGAVLRVVEQPSGGVEEPQEVEARLVAVEAAIEVEDAVCPVAVAEAVEEASDSPLISMRCDVIIPPSITRFSCHALYSYFY